MLAWVSIFLFESYILNLYVAFPPKSIFPQNDTFYLKVLLILMVHKHLNYNFV